MFWSTEGVEMSVALARYATKVQISIGFTDITPSALEDWEDIR